MFSAATNFVWSLSTLTFFLACEPSTRIDQSSCNDIMSSFESYEYSWIWWYRWVCGAICLDRSFSAYHHLFSLIESYRRGQYQIYCLISWQTLGSAVLSFLCTFFCKFFQIWYKFISFFTLLGKYFVVLRAYSHYIMHSRILRCSLSLTVNSLDVLLTWAQLAVNAPFWDTIVEP